MKPLLDLNNPVFQRDLFLLEKQEQIAVLKTLKKLAHLEWEKIYSNFTMVGSPLLI